MNTGGIVVGIWEYCCEFWGIVVSTSILLCVFGSIVESTKVLLRVANNVIPEYRQVEAVRLRFGSAAV